MDALIDAIKTLISSSDAQIAADKVVFHDLGFMKVGLSTNVSKYQAFSDRLTTVVFFQDDLSKVLTLIGPAITAIQKMRGDWGAISGDLENIKTQIGKANTVPAVILRKSPAQVVAKWNALKTAGKSGLKAPSHEPN